MIPSLVAKEMKSSIVEYLATTFALSDDDVYKELSKFLLDNEKGIFRGPYLRIKLPFIESGPDAESALAWIPSGFQPYVHQMSAWQRLAGRENEPKSTLITTGTGSGKSEAFLFPIIDHAIWARKNGQRGIKALLLYPMNALVTDQERRIAALLENSVVKEAGVTGGVWIGRDDTSKRKFTNNEFHLITDPEDLMANPPDILLTNYKMLDRLLTNAKRQKIWAANIPSPHNNPGWTQPLKYLVVDELHSYDGAQGTDVAMLLRRLGNRLQLATNSSPLTGIACVGTSATLGTSISAVEDICLFASKIFGVQIPPDGVIGEQRKSVNQVCHEIDFSLPIPNPKELIDIDASDIDRISTSFLGFPFTDPMVVGDYLLRHSVMANLLRVASTKPRRWDDVVVALAQQIPEWRNSLPDNFDEVSDALEKFVSLVSQARGRQANGKPKPLFSIEIQLWIREVTRLKRKISVQPSFRWSDSPPDPDDQVPGLELPSVYCIFCGRAGWMGIVNSAGGTHDFAIERIRYEAELNPYLESARDREKTRTLIRANYGESETLWLDPEIGQVHKQQDSNESFIPVLVGGMTMGDNSATSRNEAAVNQQCPSCGSNDSIRFLGSRVTTLASVGITQMFGSKYVADGERKLLAFTDSVQDASHRAAFFSGRTHRFNLRATIEKALIEKGRVRLPDIAETILSLEQDSMKSADYIFSLIPPDLLLDESLHDAWNSPDSASGRDAKKEIALRLEFDATLEAGLRSRLGRTLETTGTAVAQVLIDESEWKHLIKFADEALQANISRLITDHELIKTWIQGVIERLRLRGGIYHPFLDKYVEKNGNRWEIWGGATRLAPRFPRGISAPSFFSSAKSNEFDSIQGPKTWLNLWTNKVIGIKGKAGEIALRHLLDEIVEVGIFVQRNTSKGVVWGIPPYRIEFVDIALKGADTSPKELRCKLCSHRHYVEPVKIETWDGRHCLQLRCTGRYTAASMPKVNYYRALYRSGKIRRVVAEEHTGLLKDNQREKIETGFKDGTSPDSPNLLVATPTLEMGIDIGDLSAVMLTAVPRKQSNYIQRVGRAGRSTGNSFVTTFAGSDPRSLYFLNDPELMISGDIAAPSCYLDAIEILRRQYVAFLLDQAAQGDDGPIPNAGQMPEKIGKLAKNGMNDKGWFSAILDVGKNKEMVRQFIGLFGDHLQEKVIDRLETWAETEMRTFVEHELARWQRQIASLHSQRDRLNERLKPLNEKKNPSNDDEETIRRLVVELQHIAYRINKMRDQDTLGALESLGILPNYTLFDQSVTIEVNLWQKEEKYSKTTEKQEQYKTVNSEYNRPALRAIKELAPGNYFYVNAHRVLIDAVENGTEHEPAHQKWQICPQCSWATDDLTMQIKSCPRCGNVGISDSGSILKVLPLKIVSSTESELSARTSDDRDERELEWHDVQTTIDIAPEDIFASFKHSSAVFGFDGTHAATIRYLNFGPQVSPSGETTPISVNGYSANASLFVVCRLCGGVLGIRVDGKEENNKIHHRTWCKVRSGSIPPQWDSLVLSHELVTEAIRILLPIAEFEARERLQSFKALLLLGLRDSFGGDPTNIAVLTSTFPAGPGGARNQYVVIHDLVPGGTGYLTRLADPDSLHKILKRAKELIEKCDCQARGEPGCHRCLYNAVGRNDLPFVSRKIALEILNELLLDWRLEPAPQGTITGVNLAPVEQSELERMFKVLLQRWTTPRDLRISSRPDPQNSMLTLFELRFNNGVHWEIREQVHLVHQNTRPDFYATRIDKQGTPPIAIYLDGWEYHGKNPEKVDSDAQKRFAVRLSGRDVWVLTYKDVKDALTSLNQSSEITTNPSLDGQMRQAIHKQMNLREDRKYLSDVISVSPFHQLLMYFEHPDRDAWRDFASLTALCAGRYSTIVFVNEVAQTVQQIASGIAAQTAANETNFKLVTWQTISGQSGSTLVERDGDLLPRVVLSYDTFNEANNLRWQDWLHVANILQYLGDHVIITTTNGYTPDDIHTIIEYPEVVDSQIDEVLLNVIDTHVRALATVAVERGWTNLEVGFSSEDTEDTPIEVAWPESKVGILASSGTRPKNLNHWDIRKPSDWNSDDLLAALEKGTE